MYTHDAHGMIVVYDVTQTDSFDAAMVILKDAMATVKDPN